MKLEVIWDTLKGDKFVNLEFINNLLKLIMSTSLGVGLVTLGLGKPTIIKVSKQPQGWFATFEKESI